MMSVPPRLSPLGAGPTGSSSPLRLAPLGSLAVSSGLGVQHQQFNGEATSSSPSPFATKINHHTIRAGSPVTDYHNQNSGQPNSPSTTSSSMSSPSTTNTRSLAEFSVPRKISMSNLHNNSNGVPPNNAAQSSSPTLMNGANRYPSSSNLLKNHHPYSITGRLGHLSGSSKLNHSLANVPTLGSPNSPVSTGDAPQQITNPLSFASAGTANVATITATMRPIIRRTAAAGNAPSPSSTMRPPSELSTAGSGASGFSGIPLAPLDEDYHPPASLSGAAVMGTNYAPSSAAHSDFATPRMLTSTPNISASQPSNNKYAVQPHNAAVHSNAHPLLEMFDETNAAAMKSMPASLSLSMPSQHANTGILPSALAPLHVSYNHSHIGSNPDASISGLGHSSIAGTARNASPAPPLLPLGFTGLSQVPHRGPTGSNSTNTSHTTGSSSAQLNVGGGLVPKGLLSDPKSSPLRGSTDTPSSGMTSDRPLGVYRTAWASFVAGNASNTSGAFPNASITNSYSNNSPSNHLYSPNSKPNRSSTLTAHKFAMANSHTSSPAGNNKPTYTTAKSLYNLRELPPVNNSTHNNGNNSSPVHLIDEGAFFKAYASWTHEDLVKEIIKLRRMMLTGLLFGNGGGHNAGGRTHRSGSNGGGENGASSAHTLFRRQSAATGSFFGSGPQRRRSSTSLKGLRSFFGAPPQGTQAGPSSQSQLQQPNNASTAASDASNPWNKIEKMTQAHVRQVAANLQHLMAVEGEIEGASARAASGIVGVLSDGSPRPDGSVALGTGANTARESTFHGLGATHTFSFTSTVSPKHKYAQNSTLSPKGSAFLNSPTQDGGAPFANSARGNESTSLTMNFNLNGAGSLNGGTSINPELPKVFTTEPSAAAYLATDETKMFEQTKQQMGAEDNGNDNNNASTSTGVHHSLSFLSSNTGQFSMGASHNASRNDRINGMFANLGGVGPLNQSEQNAQLQQSITQPLSHTTAFNVSNHSASSPTKGPPISSQDADIGDLPMFVPTNSNSSLSASPVDVPPPVTTHTNNGGTPNVKHSSVLSTTVSNSSASNSGPASARLNATHAPSAATAARVTVVNSNGTLVSPRQGQGIVVGSGESMYPMNVSPLNELRKGISGLVHGSNNQQSHSAIGVPQSMYGGDHAPQTIYFGPTGAYNDGGTLIGSFAFNTKEVTKANFAADDDFGDSDDDGMGFKTLNEYLLVEEIGRGQYGIVYSAVKEGTDKRFVVKLIEKRKIRKRFIAATPTPAPTSNDEKVLDQLLKGESAENAMSIDGDDALLIGASKTNQSSDFNSGDSPKKLTSGVTMTATTTTTTSFDKEIELMKKLRHRNIVKLEEVIDDPEDENLYLVMPYIERGPIVKIENNRCDPQDIDVIRNYMRQLLSAVSYLHKNMIVHCDIKPDNILLGANGMVYLTDFGVSEMFSSDIEKDGVDTLHRSANHVISPLRTFDAGSENAPATNSGGNNKRIKANMKNGMGGSDEGTNPAGFDWDEAVLKSRQSTIITPGDPSNPNSPWVALGTSAAKMNSYYSHNSSGGQPQRVQSFQQHSFALKSTKCTPAFAAPETLTGNVFNGAKADVWSVGVCMYLMLFGRLPFGSLTSNVFDLFAEIAAQGSLVFTASLPTEAMPPVLRFLKRLKKEEARERAWALATASHKSFKSSLDSNKTFHSVNGGAGSLRLGGGGSSGHVNNNGPSVMTGSTSNFAATIRRRTAASSEDTTKILSASRKRSGAGAVGAEASTNKSPSVHGSSSSASSSFSGSDNDSDDDYSDEENEEDVEGLGQDVEAICALQTAVWLSKLPCLHNDDESTSATDREKLLHENGILSLSELELVGFGPDHGLVKKYKNALTLLQLLLNRNSEDRLCAAKALEHPFIGQSNFTKMRFGRRLDVSPTAHGHTHHSHGSKEKDKKSNSPNKITSSARLPTHRKDTATVSSIEVDTTLIGTAASSPSKHRSDNNTPNQPNKEENRNLPDDVDVPMVEEVNIPPRRRRKSEVVIADSGNADKGHTTNNNTQTRGSAEPSHDRDSSKDNHSEAVKAPAITLRDRSKEQKVLQGLFVRALNNMSEAADGFSDDAE